MLNSCQLFVIFSSVENSLFLLRFLFPNPLNPLSFVSATASGNTVSLSYALPSTNQTIHQTGLQASRNLLSVQTTSQSIAPAALQLSAPTVPQLTGLQLPSSHTHSVSVISHVSNIHKTDHPGISEIKQSTTALPPTSTSQQKQMTTLFDAINQSVPTSEILDVMMISTNSNSSTELMNPETNQPSPAGSESPSTSYHMDCETNNNYMMMKREVSVDILDEMDEEFDDGMDFECEEMLRSLDNSTDLQDKSGSYQEQYMITSSAEQFMASADCPNSSHFMYSNNNSEQYINCTPEKHVSTSTKKQDSWTALQNINTGQFNSIVAQENTTLLNQQYTLNGSNSFDRMEETEQTAIISANQYIIEESDNIIFPSKEQYNETDKYITTKQRHGKLHTTKQYSTGEPHISTDQHTATLSEYSLDQDIILPAVNEKFFSGTDQYTASSLRENGDQSVNILGTSIRDTINISSIPTSLVLSNLPTILASLAPLPFHIIGSIHKKYIYIYI